MTGVVRGRFPCYYLFRNKPITAERATTSWEHSVASSRSPFNPTDGAGSRSDSTGDRSPQAPASFCCASSRNASGSRSLSNAKDGLGAGTRIRRTISRIGAKCRGSARQKNSFADALRFNRSSMGEFAAGRGTIIETAPFDPVDQAVCCIVCHGVYIVAHVA